MSGPKHTVHVRVNDAATGEPTPVRIRFFNREGDYFAPFGRLTEFATGANENVGGNLQLVSDKPGCSPSKYAYIDGSCEIALPADPVQVEVSKGPEYTPLQREVTLGPGKLALRLAIERWIDLQQERWYAGDIRAHFLSPHAALLEGTAEDLAVVNLLIREWRHSQTGGEPPRLSIPHILEFSGQKPLLETPGHLVVVNTLNEGSFLGSLGLLNCHRVVYPLSTGWAPGNVHDWALADWCDQCHRKGGLVVWTHFGRSVTGRGEDSFSGEALAELVLGKIDALEINELDGNRNPQIDEWYRFLACGFRVPIAGASGKTSNDSVLGHIRTYAQLQPGEEFTYKNWIEAVRAGRTFVTNGPLLFLTVNGQDPGATIELAGESRTVHVRAEARSIVPFERLEVIVNCLVVAGVEATGCPTSGVLETDLEVPEGGWLAARCWGPHVLNTAGHPVRVAAHTSPIYVPLPGKEPAVDPFSLALLTERLDRMLAWVDNEARFENDRQKENLAGIFQAARNELVRRGNG